MREKTVKTKLLLGIMALVLLLTSCARPAASGPTIRLAVAVLKDQRENHQPDPVILLSGGPGEKTVHNTAAIAQLLASVHPNRDLIIFDQRGAGLFEPALECPEVVQAVFDLLDEPDPDELFSLLAQQLGFDPELESVASTESGSFVWHLYSFEYQSYWADLALTEGGGKAYFVLLITPPDERDALYETVFLPVVEALAPLE